MLITAPTARRVVLLALMLASLVALADGVARRELQQATGELTFVMAAAPLVGTSKE
jgi:hypothetical protein